MLRLRKVRFRASVNDTQACGALGGGQIVTLFRPFTGSDSWSACSTMELPETESKSHYHQLQQVNILEKSYKETSLYSTIRVQSILATRLQPRALNLLAPCSSLGIEAYGRTCRSAATIEIISPCSNFFKKGRSQVFVRREHQQRASFPCNFSATDVQKDRCDDTNLQRTIVLTSTGQKRCQNHA